MSERQEILGLGSEETRSSSRGKKPFSTERTGIPRGKTMDLAFQASYGSSLTPTGQEICGLQKGATSSFAHLTQEIGAGGWEGELGKDGNKRREKKREEKREKKREKNREEKREKKREKKRGEGKDARSSDQGVQLAGRESSGFTGSAAAPRFENSRVQPSKIPPFSNSAASGELHQESYDNYWYGNIPVSDPAGRAPSWAQGGSRRPYPGDSGYSQGEGSLGRRQNGTAYSNGSWGHHPEGGSSWDHGVHRLQLPSRHQFFPNPQPALSNPPSPWKQQQPRGYYNNWSQRFGPPRDRQIHDYGSRLSGNSTPLPAPVPTQDYLAKSLLKPQTLPRAPKQLLVLDLNGTLVYRTRSNTISPVCRPELGSFLGYIFTHFSVMVWTSAQPENAQRMVNKIFTKEQKKKLLTVWARDTLQLTPNQYHEKTTVYKRLTRIWAGEFKLCFPSPHQSGPGWDQTNTILMDDSSVKAVGQPYNLIRVPEFVGDMEEGESTVLSDCIKYLNELRFQDNVSAFIRQSPFYGRY